MKLIIIVMLFAISLPGTENVTNLKTDEQIVFYPTVAQRVPGETNSWRAEIRGCVFEVENRRFMVATFREALELKTEAMTSAQSFVFGERARLFLVDHERGKKVFIRLGTNEFYVGKSGADGRFAGKITFPFPGTAVLFEAALPPSDDRIMSGAIFPLAAEGISVISDIDDTIKITEVRDKQATLRNTFLRGFEAVPGMAEFYQRLARNPLTQPSATSMNRSAGLRPGAKLRQHTNAPGQETGAPNTGVAFHYISASPWQLYEPLAALVASNGFPAGTFELKTFRWKNRSFFSLFADPVKYKTGVITPLLKQFPQRKFILIGDSGERDPEIYGALARKFPEQIIRIYIRDVTEESTESPRYEQAFRNVPRAKWQIFREPNEIKVAIE